MTVFCTSANAETPPDAGATIRDVQPEIMLVPRSDPTLTLPEESNKEVLDKTPFTIQHFSIQGAELFTESTLLALIADLTGEGRTLADINTATTRITAYYRNQGYPLARAYLPPQKLADGNVLIKVLEGKLGSLSLQNQSRLNDNKVDAIAGHIPIGKPLRINQANRAILLLRDTPGVGDVLARVAAGEKSGETNLTLDLTPAPSITGRLEADNYGSLYTGKNRVGGSINFNSLLGLGERISAQVLASNESLYYERLTGQLPIGSDGMNLGVNLSHVQYELGDIFKSLNATGRVNSAELFVTYPFVRDLTFNLTGQASIKYSDLKDEIKATNTTVDKSIKKTSWALMMNNRDNWLGGGLNEASAGITLGELSIDSSSARALDAVRARTEGTYGILNFETSRLQFVTKRISLSLSAKGQLATKNLDSSEKFALGGPYAVRAYPIGEGTGDKGWLVNAEVRYALLPSLYGSIYYDVGEVHINQKPFLATANTRRLAGPGLGVGGNYKAFNWKALIAWREANESVAEKDKTPRLWLQGSLGF